MLWVKFIPRVLIRIRKEHLDLVGKIRLAFGRAVYLLIWLFVVELVCIKSVLVERLLELDSEGSWQSIWTFFCRHRGIIIDQFYRKECWSDPYFRGSDGNGSCYHCLQHPTPCWQRTPTDRLFLYKQCLHMRYLNFFKVSMHSMDLVVEFS